MIKLIDRVTDLIDNLILGAVTCMALGIGAAAIYMTLRILNLV